MRFLTPTPTLTQVRFLYICQLRSLYICQVRFLAGGDSIVESLRIRPASGHGRDNDNAPAAASVGLAKQSSQLGPGLLAWWVLNEDRVVRDVLPKAKLLAISLDTKAKAVHLFGTPKAIATATMLIDIHAKQQAA